MMRGVKTTAAMTFFALLLGHSLSALAQSSGNDASVTDRIIPAAPAIPPRPIAPSAPTENAAAAFNCATAGENPGAGPMNTLNTAMAQLRAMGTHGTDLSHWYGGFFLRAGIWSQVQADLFASSIRERPEMAAHVQWGRTLMAGIMGDFEQIQIAERSRDFPAACRALVRMLNQLDGAPIEMTNQWAIIRRLYADEAQRSGITLPE
jgi:hypothetical protein